MRVAVDVSAIPVQPAGAGVYVLEVVRALDAVPDIDLVLVSRRTDVDRWTEVAPGAEVVGAAPSPRPLRLLWEQAQAPSLARRLGVDVWHGPHYTMPLARRAPVAVTVHDLTFFDHPEWHEPSKVRFFPPMIRSVARLAESLICVSEHTARRLDELLAPDVPIVVASHGVDTTRFHPHGRGDDRLLSAVGIRRPFVAFVGTVEPRKNVPGLVRAMARLGGDVQLVVAGQLGWGAEELDAAVRAAGMGHRVLRLGWVEGALVPALLRQAAAVAYPAFEEGFGLPALEALACGGALVTTTGTAMEEVVGGAALLVPPGDEAALTGALAALLAGGPDVDRLRAGGPAVAARHTWARSAAAHVAAYRLAVGSRP